MVEDVVAWYVQIPYAHASQVHNSEKFLNPRNFLEFKDLRSMCICIYT